MAARTAEHATFSLERTIDAPVAKVYQAFADKEAKQKWFKGPDGNPDEHTMDFKVGGREVNEGKFHDGTTHRFEALYYEIIPNERIIYTYEMHINDQRISVSVATIEFQDLDGQTDLKLTENGVFLDGLDTAESRMRGTEGLLDQLIESLA